MLLANAHKATKRHDTGALSACQRAEPAQYQYKLSVELQIADCPLYLEIRDYKA
jgi:hypothetical protein